MLCLCFVTVNETSSEHHETINSNPVRNTIKTEFNSSVFYVKDLLYSVFDKDHTFIYLSQVQTTQVL